MPAISVILTSYNCRPYIGQAIDSILGQTFGDFELLISDDGSTDGSPELIRDYARKDPRIRAFFQPENLGLVRNYNFLFDKAQGALIAIQDADDWSDPRRFQQQVAVLDNPDFVLCATGNIYHFPRGRKPSDCSSEARIINGIDDNFTAHPASTMFRASMLQQFGGWPLYFAGGTSMDRYFLMELLEGKKGYQIGEALYHARMRPSSSHRTWGARKMTTDHLFVELERQRRATGSDWLKDRRFDEMERFEEAIRLDRKLMSESIRGSAVINVDCSNFGTAARLLAHAVALDPFSPTNWKSVSYLLRTSLGQSAG